MNLSVIKAAGFVELLGGVFIMLTLVAFNSGLTEPPFNGTFYIGPGLAIASSVIGLVTGMLILTIPKENVPPADRSFQPPHAQAFQETPQIES